MTRRSLSVPPAFRNPVAMGHCGLLLPVFKTGRAGQPPAWKVRFLRRVVAGNVGLLMLSEAYRGCVSLKNPRDVPRGAPRAAVPTTRRLRWLADRDAAGYRH